MRIGVDLGGTKIEGIILSNDGSIAEKIRMDTPSEQYKATLEAICGIVNTLQANSPSRLSVGIGTPGALSVPSELMKNCNSICLNGKPFKHDIESLLGYEIRMENEQTVLRFLNHSSVSEPMLTQCLASYWEQEPAGAL